MVVSEVRIVHLLLVYLNFFGVSLQKREILKGDFKKETLKAGLQKEDLKSETSKRDFKSALQEASFNRIDFAIREDSKSSI